MPAHRKIKKASGLPRLDLVRNPDILSLLPQLAPNALRVGFAAETTELESEALRKLETKGAHLLVANDVSRPDIGFGAEENEVVVFRRDGAPLRPPRQHKSALARELVELFVRELRNLRRDAAVAAER